MTPEEFFRNISISETGCHLWTGGRCKAYGSLRIGRTVIKAHRLAYALAYGPIPRGAHVLHSCDVGICVNPQHLRLGTHKDNMRDKKERGRVVSKYGEQSHLAKLTFAQVQEIRAMVSAGALQRVVAEKFGTTQTNVSLIVRRKSWT